MKSHRFIKEWLDHFQRLVKEKVTVNETVTSCHMNKRVLSPTDAKGGIKNTDHLVRLLVYLIMKMSEKQFMEFWTKLGQWTYQSFDRHGDEILQFYDRKGERGLKAEGGGLKAESRGLKAVIRGRFSDLTKRYEQNTHTTFNISFITLARSLSYPRYTLHRRH